MTRPIPVTFYTRRNCHLCDDARNAIRASGVPVILEEIDIDHDPELQARFTNDVPVIYIDGVEAFRHRVDPAQFAAYVRALPARELPAGAHDFDFIHGRWRVEHRKLRERLAGSTDWLTLTGTCDARPVLGGLGNVDSLRFDGDSFEGVTLRLFDLAAQVWTIHWSDTRSGRLDPPLTGRFENGTGIFYGDDTHNGRAVRVRFLWKDLGPNLCTWEQAFSADGGATWETNWTMRFTRVGS